MAQAAQLENQVDYLLGLMGRFHRLIDAHLGKKTGTLAAKLTLGQMRTMHYLLEHGPATMRETAKNGGVAMSTMSDMANRLVKLGVVRRVADSTDRRIIRLEVTRSGIRDFGQKAQIMRKTMMGILGNLSSREMKDVITAFKTIESILWKGNRLPSGGK